MKTRLDLKKNNTEIEVYSFFKNAIFVMAENFE